MRLINRMIAALAAILAGAAGFFALVEGTAMAFGWLPVFPWLHTIPAYARQHTPADRWSIVAAVALVVVGVVLLLVQLRRRDRTRRVKTTTPYLHLAATPRVWRTLQVHPPASDAHAQSSRGPRIPLGRGVDRINRVLLTLAAVILLAVGVVSLVAAVGGLGSARQQQPLQTPAMRQWLIDQRTWLWFAVAGAGLLVLLLAVWWLLAQLAVRRIGGLDVDDATRIPARPFANTVQDELEAVPGVDTARASVRRRHGNLELLASVLIAADGDVTQVRRTIEDIVVPDARDTAGLGDLPVRVTLDQQPGSHTTPPTHRSRDHGDASTSTNGETHTDR